VIKVGEDKYAYFYSKTRCFQLVLMKVCGGGLEMAFNLIEGRVDYIWCPRCGYFHYRHQEYKK